jgi:hypothetical protein
MAIISMPQRTLAEMVESTIVLEEEKEKKYGEILSIFR